MNHDRRSKMNGILSFIVAVIWGSLSAQFLVAIWHAYAAARGSDWQSVGAHGRILLDRPRQGVARHLNDHLLLASKWVFRHAISSNSVRHAIKVSARPRKSPPKPKVQWVSGPLISPNRAYATLPAARRERTSQSLRLSVENNIILPRFDGGPVSYFRKPLGGCGLLAGFVSYFDSRVMSWPTKGRKSASSASAASLP
jgi:hypothetical protein